MALSTSEVPDRGSMARAQGGLDPESFGGLSPDSKGARSTVRSARVGRYLQAGQRPHDKCLHTFAAQSAREQAGLPLTTGLAQLVRCQAPSCWPPYHAWQSPLVRESQVRHWQRQDALHW